MEAVVFVEGSALGGTIGTLDVPVDTDGLIVQGDKTRPCTTFCPNCFTIGEFDKSGEFLVEEKVVPLLCTDEADGTGRRPAAA